MNIHCGGGGGERGVQKQSPRMGASMMVLGHVPVGN